MLDRVDRLADQPRREAGEVEPDPRLVDEMERGEDEADQRPAGGPPRAPPPRQVHGAAAAPAARVRCAVVPKRWPRRAARSTTTRTHHDRQHDQRELRRAGEVRLVDPGRIDRQRQRPHAEEFRGADVVERLHQRQARADRDGGARQRQGDPEEDPALPGAERARGIDQARRLHQEQRPRREIDVGVEHEAEEQDRTRESTAARAGGNRAARRCRGCRGSGVCTGPIGCRRSR